MIKLIVAGCRDYDDYFRFERVLKDHIRDLGCARTRDIEIVQGGAKGVDAMAKRFAVEYGLPSREFVADWDNNGKAAGPIRNREMAKYATHLLAFHDGVSRGTKNMVHEANKIGKSVKVVKI